MGLFSPSEIVMLARRIQIAKKLLAKESYRTIHEEMHVGEGTITSLDKYGQLRVVKDLFNM